MYDNGASKVVDEIYENTPDEIRSTIDSKMLSDNIKQQKIKDSIYNGQKEFLDTAGGVAVTTVPLIASAPALVAAPGAMVGGLVAGALGAEGTNALVRGISGNRYQN